MQVIVVALSTQNCIFLLQMRSFKVEGHELKEQASYDTDQ